MINTEYKLEGKLFIEIGGQMHELGPVNIPVRVSFDSKPTSFTRDTAGSVVPSTRPMPRGRPGYEDSV